MRERVSTHYLSSEQALNLRAASDHSVKIGAPFSRFLTISWELGGVGDTASATSKFLKLYSDAMTKRKRRPAWAYTHEVGRIVGLHTHFLLHVPHDLRRWFNRLVNSWLKICGAVRAKGVRDSRPVAWFGNAVSAAYLENLRSAVEYMIKGTDPEVAADINLEDLSYQGLVVGKRAGISVNLRPAARQKMAAPARHRSHWATTN